MPRDGVILFGAQVGRLDEVMKPLPRPKPLPPPRPPRPPPPPPLRAGAALRRASGLVRGGPATAIYSFLTNTAHGDWAYLVLRGGS
jgi:hypothetical protein